MREQEVVLVNWKDEPTGTVAKMAAHQQGLLHRAFSVFIFDTRGRMLLQQRALQKYHGGGLWTNACCSHPYPQEKVEDAAARRLKEELGFSTPLQKIFTFTYKAEVENGLIEHEYDHVFAGEYESTIRPDGDEVMDYCYKSLADIKESINDKPQAFTYWFKLALPEIEKWWRSRY